MLDSNKIRHEISKLYNKDPQGWQVLVGRDRSGFYDLLVSQGRQAWQIKEFEVNPFKFVGLGTKIPNSTVKPFATVDHPFGLRPIALDQMKELATLIDDPKAMNELTAQLLNQKPVTSAQVAESSAFIHGPILHSPSPLETISTAHSKLDDRLRKELRHLVSRDFRHTVVPYL